MKLIKPKSFVLCNGIVETMTRPAIPTRLRPDSVAVTGGKIVAVGKRLEADPEFAAYRKIDLEGATVLSGFVDSHTHIVMYAHSLGRLRLHSVTSLDAALCAIADFARAIPIGEWIFGEGMFVSAWKNPLWPTAEMLDKVSAGRPLFVYSKDYHSACVNSRALELIGYNAKTRDPIGGRIERLASGSPSGVLRESPAYGPAYTLATARPPKKRDALFDQALAIAYERGVTGVHSFDSYAGYEYLRQRAAKKTLGLRVTHYLLADGFLEHGYSASENAEWSDWLRVAGVKQFADGSLGSQTALCFTKYIGSKSNYGVEASTVKQMRVIARKAARQGLASAIHAIGDKAVANVLDTLAETPRVKSAPHRIEHVQMIRPSDIARLARLKIVAAMQPSHLPSDIALINSFWGARGRNCFPFRSLQKAGATLAFGSDVPIEPLDPLGGIADAVNRRSHSTRATLTISERISALEAAYGFIRGAAFAAGEESYSGSILPGYRADLVILDHDLRRCPPAQLGGVAPLATILDGRFVYLSPHAPFGE